MKTEFNFAEVFELAAEVRGEAPALVHGGLRRSWAELDRRAGGIASCLFAEGLVAGDKVAQYLYNGNEYLESVFASVKASMVPVNTNYRYGDEELVYLWDNADAAAVVFHGCFTERIDRLRPRLGRVKLWLHVDDGSGPCPEFALAYEQAATSLAPGADRHVRAPRGRSGDDLYLLYTGGTTGMPKGVMWRQDDLFVLLNRSNVAQLPLDGGLAAVRAALVAIGEAAPVLLPACPLMHGTGSFTSFGAMFLGGTVATLTSRSFDAVELLETVEREGVNLVTIVGDAFGKPILAALDAGPGRFDLSSVIGIVSSGVMWSEQTKHALLAHRPTMTLIDAFSSSEALGMGSSVSSAGDEAGTARFRIGEHARLVDDDGKEIAPGTGEIGRLALGGRLPLGYYKDEAKTAATFVELDGERFSIPGDYATVDADGTLHLLGRGSVCINTGGEKVYPEEVDEVLKTHPGVFDAACVGVPDERFGEIIAAVVEPREAVDLDQGELIALVKSKLAPFKAPRLVAIVDDLGRSPSGKLDYAHLRRIAEDAAARATRL